MILSQGFQTISSQLDWLPFILLLWRGVAMVVKVELKEGRFLLLFHRSGNWEDALVDPLSIHSTLPQFGLKSFPCVLQVPPYPLLSKLGLGQMAHLLSNKRALSPKNCDSLAYQKIPYGRSNFDKRLGVSVSCIPEQIYWVTEQRYKNRKIGQNCFFFLSRILSNEHEDM